MAKEKNKLKKILVPFPDEQIEKLERMMEPLGTIDITNTVRASVALAYKTLFKDYVEIRKQAASKDPVEKAKATIIAKEALDKEKEASEQRKQEAICLLMDEASITPHPETGRPSCHYPVFTPISNWKVTKTWYDEELPLLADNTPELQYRGLFGETGEKGKASCLDIINKMGKTPDQL